MTNELWFYCITQSVATQFFKESKESLINDHERLLELSLKEVKGRSKERTVAKQNEKDRLVFRQYLDRIEKQQINLSNQVKAKLSKEGLEEIEQAISALKTTIENAYRES